MIMASHGFYCSVDNCKSNAQDNVSFFRCPKDPIRSQQWKDNLGFVGDHKFAKITTAEAYSRIRICKAHFGYESFSSSGKRLLKTAVPLKLVAKLEVFYQEGHEILDPSRIQTPVLKFETIETDMEQELISGSIIGITRHEERLQSDVSTKSQGFVEDHKEEIHEIPGPSDLQTPVLKFEADENIIIKQELISESESEPVSDHTANYEEHLQSDAATVSGYYQKYLEYASSQTSPKSKKTLKKQPLKKKKRKDVTLEDVLKFLDEHYPAKDITLIRNQLLLLEKSHKEAGYSDEFMQLSLTLFLLGPKAYKILSNFIRLPSRAVLKRMIVQWKIYPGFDEFFFKIFDLRVPLMYDKSKDCLICIDEMPIKPNLFYNISRDVIVGFEELHNKKSTNIATRALVLMARGISYNWQQPISYFFCKNSTSVEDLREIIMESIRKLKSIGLNVLAVTSNQRPNFYKLVKSCLKLTVDKPYFYVDDSIIFYLFNIPHLLKSTRNNFLSYNFYLDDSVINKCYLKTMYDLDKLKQYRLAPTLTEEHINPKSSKKMKVKLASQLFSHSVAVALHTYIEFKQLTPEAKPTANFVENMSKLFDITNSSNSETCQAFTGTPEQLKFLNKMDTIFSNLKVLNKKGIHVTRTFKFIYGWGLTISSLLKLWQVLRNKNYTFLLTSNLNQDCLENYFDQIRNTCGNVRNPTAIQFTRAYKKSFAVNCFHEAEGNCLEDATDLLLAITPDLICKSEFLKEQMSESVTSILAVQTSDYQNLLKDKGNTLTSVGGYLLLKCLLKHSCDTCLDYYLPNLNRFGGSKEPPETFTNYLISLEKMFVSNFNNFCNRNGVGYSMVKEFSNLKLEHMCPNFPHNYLVSLYIRVRIYCSLKFANSEIKYYNWKKENPELKILQNL